MLLGRWGEAVVIVCRSLTVVLTSVSFITCLLLKLKRAVRSIDITRNVMMGNAIDEGEVGDMGKTYNTSRGCEA